MIGTDLSIAKKFLEQNDLIAIPTETVYGLAGNALSPEAVTKIYRVKNRPTFNPLIVHVPSFSSIYRYCSNIPDVAKELAANFMPGPLTLLLKRSSMIPDIVTAGSNLVGIRIPNHPVSLELLKILAFPIAAPSANPSGYISPTKAKHVEAQLGDRIPYILDGGSCQVGVESTIVGFEGELPVIYRVGGITVEQLEKVLGKVLVNINSVEKPNSPGLLKSHYAPKVRLIIGDISLLLSQFDPEKVGVISLNGVHNEVPKNQQVILSLSGNLEEAAQNLFAGMRHLDGLDLEVILAEAVPDYGLGKAINDRLRRASI